MGRKRSFLGFFASLFVFAFSLNAFAAGYVCDKEYDWCSDGYYLDDGVCLDCTDATNSTSTQTCTLTCTVEHADLCTCSNDGSQTCNGKYTGGNGTGGDGGAANQCTGCDNWGACSGTCNPNIVCSKNYYLDNGQCLACADVTFTDSGTDTTNTNTCPDGTEKVGATGTSQTWERTCHRTGTSAAGATSAEECTGTDNCGNKDYGTCVATGCSGGYHLVDGACVLNTFTVTYAGNGNTGGTNPGSHTCTYGDTSCRAKANTFEKTNYEFSGWTATCSNGCTLGQTDVPAGDDISTIATENGVTITLTAKWTQKSGSGDCECTNGTGATSCTATVNGTQCDYTWSCKNGYWNNQQSATGEGTSFTATCTVCPSGASGSDGDRDARSTCFYNCPNKTVTNASSVTKDAEKVYYTGSAYSTCTYTVTCSEGYTASGNGTANPTCDANTITLTYNNGGHGTAPTSPSSCRYGESFTMPAAITADGYLFKKWSVNNKTFDASASVTCNKANLGVASGTATITATWDDCEAGHYCDEDGDHTCPTEYPYSDTNSDDIHKCYRNCGAGDIPHATSYTSDSKFYYGDEAPSQCKAANCESGYDGEDCDPAGGTKYYVCHYVKEIGKSSYTFCPAGALDDGCTMSAIINEAAGTMPEPDSGSVTARHDWLVAHCQEKTGVTESSITLSQKAYSPLPGFTYSKGCAYTTGSAISGNSYAACTNTQTTTILAGDARMVLLFYNRNDFSLNLTKDDGVASVSGAGTYEFDAPVTINATVNGGYKWSKWIQTSGGQTVSTTKQYSFSMPASNLNYKATTSDCEAGHYCDEDGDHTCPTEYPYSDTNSDDIHKCYRNCGAGDIPHATSYTSDSKFYYGDEAPSQCKAANCESGYDGEDCHEASGIAYQVCHYTKNVGASTYTLYNNACENKTGTSNATVTLANLKKTITGFTYDAGFAGTSTNGTTKPSSGAVTTTTVLPNGTRVIDLYYNRNTHTLTLTKGTGVDSVSGAGTKEYGASVTIDATLTTNYTWVNWTDNYGDGAQVTTTKQYTFNMLDDDMSFQANAVLGARDCAAGKTASGAACPKGSYCPARTGIPASESCEIACPADTQGGTVTTESTGSTQITDCYTTRTCVPVNGGGADRISYYLGTLDNGSYSDDRKTTVTYCIAGYWRATDDATSCSPVGTGAWSPDRANQTTCNDEASRGKNLCSDLNGANDTTTTGGENAETSGSPTDCYNTCPEVLITVGGEVIGKKVPAQEQVYYNGTTIPTCTYPNNKIECEDGYEPSGDTCVPSVFTITLNHNCNNECTNTPTSPIYLKYNTGWYATSADAAAGTNPITAISSVPSWPGNTFAGYLSGQNVVISSTGSLTANYKVFTANATVVASWGENASITCQPGTYYTGTGDTCTDCPAGSYCDEEITVVKDTNVESGKKDCPAASSSNYTPAQTWNGTALVNVEPNVNSPAKSEDISACYATVQYTATKGKGSRICHYAAGKYLSNCHDETILTCDSGHWLANATDTDCSEVGKKHYSEQYVTTREDCPLFGTEYESRLDTETTTDAVVTKCMLNGVWKNVSHGGSTSRCHYVIATDDYSENCDSYTIRICDAGYWDQLEGAISATAVGCVQVGDGYYSPAQSACSGEPAKPIDILGCSTMRTACQGTDKYAGDVSDDLNPSVANPATGTETASSESACYLTCKETKTSGSITYTVTNSPVHYDGTQYPLCEYESDEISCSGLTNGQYPLPTSGATDISECYRDCTTSDIPGSTAVSGTVTYTGTRTCTADSCGDGYCIARDASTGLNICIEKPDNGQCTNDPDHPISCNEGYHLNNAGTDCVANEITLRFANGGHGTAPTNPNKCTYGQRFTMPAAIIVTDGYEFDKWSVNNKTFAASASVVCNKANLGVASGTATITATWNLCENNHYCDETGKHECPAGWPHSAAGSTSKTDCYRDCDGGTASDGCVYTPIPGKEKAYWDAVCEYTATMNGNPAEYNPDTDSCTTTGCQQGYQLVDGECVPCEDNEYALSYVPGQGCKVEACIIGYHPAGDHCDPDTQECTAPHATYAEHKWIASRGAYDICIIKSCEEGYHLASNACVADEQVCEIENGAGMKTWNYTTNSWGPCIATSCVPGYTNDPYKKNNASQQCSECRNKFSTLGEVAAESYLAVEEDCVIAACMYEGQKYHLDKGLNECMPICDQPYSDETGSLRWNNSTKKCERTCNPGYISW